MNILFLPPSPTLLSLFLILCFSHILKGQVTYFHPQPGAQAGRPYYEVNYNNQPPGSNQQRNNYDSSNSYVRYQYGATNTRDQYDYRYNPRGSVGATDERRLTGTSRGDRLSRPGEYERVAYRVPDYRGNPFDRRPATSDRNTDARTPRPGYNTRTSGYDGRTSGYDARTAGYDTRTDTRASGYDTRTDTRTDTRASGYDTRTSGYDNRLPDRRREDPRRQQTPPPRNQFPRRNCNCSRDGSVADECDDVGQCHCRPNVVGRLCDRCAQNFIALSPRPVRGECRECNPCYKLLEPEIEKLRERLRRLRQKISDGGGANQLTDRNFEDVLREVKSFVDGLYQEALRASNPSGGAVAKFREYQRLLQELIQKMNDVVSIREAINDKKESGRSNVDDAEASLQRIEGLLRQLQDLIRREGRDALNQAKDAEREFGKQSQEMAQMAEESRRLAEQHEQEANSIKSKAEEALSTSNQAKQLAREAFEKQEQASRSLAQLQRGFGPLQYELNDLKAYAVSVYKSTKECRAEAQKIFDLVRRGTVPAVSLEDVRRQSQDVTRRADSIRAAAERLKSQYGGIMDDIREKIRAAEQMYYDAKNLQQLMDQLLGEADRAYNIAIEAKTKADGIINEAQETLRILRNFDSEVQNSKDTADGALGLIPEIERLIAEAELKTRNANEALVGGGQQAEGSLSDATEALDLATRAQNDLMPVIPEIRATSQKAQQGRAKAEELEVEVDKKDAQLQGLENEADRDMRRAADTERMSKEAEDAAGVATDKAEGVLEDLMRLLDQLSKAGSVNPGFVTKLRGDMNDLDAQLRDLNLDEQLSRLEVGAKQQQVLIDRYTLDLTQLEKDVQNVEDIQEELPEGCYKFISLETGARAGAGVG